MIYAEAGNKFSKLAIKDASPIVAGYFAVSFVFGLMCINQGLPVWLPTLISLVVYAGAAQFSFLALVSAEAGVLTVITTTLLINLRHMLMSVYMSEHFEKRGFSNKFKWLYGYGLTDESFAYHSVGINNDNMDQHYLTTFNLSCHLSWVMGSLFGTLTALYLNEVISFDLSYALVAMMIFVLVSLANTFEKVLVALSSIVVTVILMLLFSSYMNIFIATFIGCGVGICLKKKRS